MQTDFNHLYSRLGLEPGCSLHEFKQAYRRQFSELHPDRWNANAPPPHAQEQLREIIALYGSALTFHRRYGRLPGAPSPSSGQQVIANDPTPSSPGPSPTISAESSRMVAFAPAVPVDDAGQSARRRRIAMALLALCVVVLVATWNSTAPTAPERLDEPMMPTAATATSDALTGAEAHRFEEAHRLELGLDKSGVRAIQGQPVRERGDLWEYGPSWVRFERGRLVDWYSSPMNRLETATATPAERPTVAEPIL